MTNLIEFRRQQRIKKRTEELAEQLEKQNVALSHLKTLFRTHEHENYATITHVHEEYVAKTELPKPYVHPKTGVCPQKPQPHGHMAKDITDLKIPEPYDLEQLKKDHPKLTEPYLHEPKKHSHRSSEITDRIQPWQIETEGLDADTVDGKHAKDMVAEVAKKVKRVYVGGGATPSEGAGGPHASSHETGGDDKVHFADLERDEGDATLHDNFTGTPHISQTEKDKIHDRLHALDSPSDHSGSITDSQHGTRGANLHTDSHAQLHKDSHKSGGGDSFVLTDSLDCLARTDVQKAGSSIGKRRALNLIEGSNVTLTMADDATNERVNVTIASTGGGAGVAKESHVSFIAVASEVTF